MKPYLDAGFDHVYLHQVGPDQDGFLRFAERRAAAAPSRELGASKARRRAA